MGLHWLYFYHISAAFKNSMPIACLWCCNPVGQELGCPRSLCLRAQCYIEKVGKHQLTIDNISVRKKET